MSNEYNAEALAWQLVVGGQSRSILASDLLEQGVSFSVAGKLDGCCYIHVIEMSGNGCIRLLSDPERLLSGQVSIPGDGRTLTTGARGYVRVVASFAPVPAEAWPVL